jgi:GT2 family glycosyltransferase
MSLAPPSTDVLIVDDGSPNGEATAAARGYSARALRLDRRVGFCAAANAGVREARGEVVQLLNDDTEVAPGWAEAALARFADPSIVAVTPLVLRGRPGDPPVVDSAGDGYWRGGVAYKRGHGQPLGPRHLRAGPVFGASGSASFFRREAFLRVGGFPEEFVAYFDDIDLSFRLSRLGRIWYEPSSVVHHRVSSSYGRPSGGLLVQQSRNEELVWRRNLTPLQKLAWLPAHVAVLMLKALRRLREGQLGPFLAGRLAAHFLSTP